jgi:hypothetical protein
MSPRTLTAPPTDKRMWRRLMAVVHPDCNGDHDLFVWVTGLHEYVAGDDPEPVYDDRSRRERYAESSRTTERVPYEQAFGRAGSFTELTRQAVMLGAEVGEPYGALLRLLADCYEASEADGTPYRHQHQGATYRSLAAIAHRAGMSKAQRTYWYEICRAIPMSQRHAGHILSRLQSEAGAA